MDTKCFFLKVFFVFAYFLGLFSSEAIGSNGYDISIARDVTGDKAWEVCQFLSVHIGAREAGSLKEREAAEYVFSEFTSLGLDADLQEFSFRNRGLKDSQNVVATISSPISDATIIVGAHIDTVAEVRDGESVLQGADDNASGVGVLVEVASVLQKHRATHWANLVFVGFGNEESLSGGWGSEHYANELAEDPNEVEKTIAMVNLDGVGAGDFFYVYSGLDGNPGWVRDEALSIGRSMGYDLRTSPETNDLEAGTIFDLSDHVPFRLLGIPIAWFEWWNWDIDKEGWTQSEELGLIQHTAMDTIMVVEQEKLRKAVDVTAVLLEYLARNYGQNESSSVPWFEQLR